MRNKTTDIGKQRAFYVWSSTSVNPVGNRAAGCIQNKRSNHRLNVKLCDEHTIKETENNCNQTGKDKADKDCSRINAPGTQNLYKYRTRNCSCGTNGNILSLSSRSNQSHSYRKNNQLRSTV